MDADERAAARALGAIWIRNRGAILAAVDTVDDAVQHAIARRPDCGRRERAGLAAHKLAGSAGTFGFTLAGQTAARLEQALSASRPPSADEYRALAELVVVLRRELGDDRRDPQDDGPTGTPAERATETSAERATGTSVATTCVTDRWPIA